MSWGIHTHKCLTIVKSKHFVPSIQFRRGYFHLNHPQLFASFRSKYWNPTDRVLMRHQRRKHIEFAFAVDVQQESIKLVLGHFEAWNDWVIVDTNIEYSSVWVEKGSDVLHDDGGYVVVDDVSVVFKLMVSAFNQRQLLVKIELMILCIPILFLFLGLILGWWKLYHRLHFYYLYLVFMRCGNSF